MPWGNDNDQGPWSGGDKPTGANGPNGGKSRGPKKGDNVTDIDELLKKSQQSFKSAFGGGGGKGGPSAGDGGKAFVVVAGVVLALWLASGFYKVDPDEVGVEMRFGKYSSQSEPGLNYHLPYPIEAVETLRVTTVNRAEIGFRSTGSRGAKEARRNVPEESLMLTGDRNIVSTQFEVQWRIKDAKKFLFSIRSPEYLVKPIAETAMREVMGNTLLTKALSDQRQSMGDATKDLMQSIMDTYDTGIEVYEVNLLAVDAPSQVVDAFIDVLAAQQEKETLQNQAAKYRDGIIPVAQGQAEKLIKDAQGYKQAVVSRAEGDAARFMSVYKEYAQAKDVTRKRIYLETMEEVMRGMNKVIMSDGASRGVLPYLPLQGLSHSKTSKIKK